MRRRRPERRQILPDPVYKDLAVAKFINYLMERGKKGVAEKIFYDAMAIIKKKTKSDGFKIFDEAIKNSTPMLEVKSRRIGGATYQVPIEVPQHRQYYLASHWLINAAKNRSGKPMSDRLAVELISAANNEGGAIKKKDDTHRMAEANKAFAHFGRPRR
ncbi:MAG: 30S ribosomal protein S7 [Candidatus Marinimicrobia bacterium]|nr:30S ribosomal protein S7 [Candidatus Neomarinimicrobiota bacterium]MBL7059737.1 30S ribosomal protein S7 [Candidatus Neomarinimicrobiota bacterium]